VSDIGDNTEATVIAPEPSIRKISQEFALLSQDRDGKIELKVKKE